MILLYVAITYLVLGLLFSVVFVTRLITELDESAKGSTWIFRLLILPGCIALWPVLLNKYLKNVQQRNQ